MGPTTLRVNGSMVFCRACRAPLSCHHFGVVDGLRHLPFQAGFAGKKRRAISGARSLSDTNLQVFLKTNGFSGSWNLNSLTLVAFYYQPVLAEARAQWHRCRPRKSRRANGPTHRRFHTHLRHYHAPPWILVLWDIPIETAGKRGKRIAQADQLSEAARWNFVSAAWQTRSHVRAALLNLYAARETESLLARQESAQSNVVRLLEGQFAAGAVSELRSHAGPRRAGHHAAVAAGRRRPIGVRRGCNWPMPSDCRCARWTA